MLSSGKFRVRWLGWMSVQVFMIPVMAGCGGGWSMEWFKNGLLDPSQVGQFARPRRNEIRQALGILEEPKGIQNSEEPTEDDVRVVFSDAVIGPNDIISVSVFELLTPGVFTDVELQVSQLGAAKLPALGEIQVAGLTSRQLEAKLTEKIKEEGILDDPDVRVQITQSQAMQFSVIGFVSRPGPYPLPRQDYRLLDAIAAFGGISEQVQTIYVMRSTGGDAGLDPGAGEPNMGFGSFGRPVSFTMSDFSAGAAGASRGAVGQSPTTRRTVDELDILEGGPTEPPVAPMLDPKTGQWLLRSATQPAETTPPPISAPALSPMEEPVVPVAPVESPFDFAGDLSPPTRIIEIPVRDLLNHDPRYNIVIRPHDLINVPPVEQGAYYMAGHVGRPGAYRFQGKPLTIKEAVVAAGGFDALAWPARAELIRRVNEFEEQLIPLDLDAIFAGNAPDLYLKEDDMLNVGTTPISGILAVLRNSFRMSYGVGLVYDRNFADQDTFFAQEQRKNRRRIEAQARGIPFN